MVINCKKTENKKGGGSLSNRFAGFSGLWQYGIPLLSL
jgi:hypothetical protein